MGSEWRMAASYQFKGLVAMKTNYPPVVYHMDDVLLIMTVPKIKSVTPLPVGWDAIISIEMN
jgi:hypothetical protein